MKEMTLLELESCNGGGSAVGTLGGALGGATTGVKLCTPGGPWAIAGCGVVGGIAGGAFGYWTS